MTRLSSNWTCAGSSWRHWTSDAAAAAAAAAAVV